MGTLVRNPETEELRAFCASVELGSLGRAAKLLGISQPAVSKRIKALEALAGVELLVRSPHGVVPTEAGERLHRQARRFLTQSKGLAEMIGRLRGGTTGAVLIAASHTIAESVLPPTIAEFKRSEPQISIEQLSANSALVRKLVAEGRVEIGIAGKCPVIVPEDPLDERHFFSDEIVVAVPHGHRWRRMAEIPLEEFVAERMVMRDPTAGARRVVEGTLRARDRELAPPLAELGSTLAAQQTALGHGAPLLTSSLTVPVALAGEEQLLAVRPVAGIEFPREFVLVCASPEALSPAARALHEHLAHGPGHNDELSPPFTAVGHFSGPERPEAP